MRGLFGVGLSMGPQLLMLKLNQPDDFYLS